MILQENSGYMTTKNSKVLNCQSRTYHLQKTLITNKRTKHFFINCNTLLHVSPLMGHLQGDLSVVVTLRLHFTVQQECTVDCVLCCFWIGE
jgi:hypothetical protein